MRDDLEKNRPDEIDPEQVDDDSDDDDETDVGAGDSASTDPDDETQLYVADAYYAARQSFLYDLKLALKYFLRLIVPAR